MAGYITLAITVLAMFVEITPIKINPISWLIKIINKPVLDRIDHLEETVDKNDIDTVRSRILANEGLLRQGHHFKKHQYISLYKDIDKWNKYHEKYPDLNGLLKSAIEYIDECYKNEKFDD